MGLTGRADFMDGGMNGAVQPSARGPYPPNQRRGICRDYHSMLHYLILLNAPSIIYFYYRQWLLCTRRILQVQSRRRRRHSSSTIPHKRSSR